VDDRYRVLSLKALELIHEVAALDLAGIESLGRDHEKLIDMLQEFQSKVTEIDDNRLLILTDQARQKMRDQYSDKQVG